MKRSRNLMIGLSLAGSVGMLAAALRADDAPKPQAAPAGQISLEREMRTMGQSLKTIGKQVSDASKNLSTIKLVVTLEQHTLTAKSAVPDSATTMPSPAENAQKLSDYQSSMLNLLRQELDLEEQLRANQNDKAEKTVESLHGLETQGHEQFRPKEN